jgi:hypothetical protein
MSATDEELHFVNDELEMDHVTYILIMFRFVFAVSAYLAVADTLLSLAFLIYALVVSRIRLWATSGKNAAGATQAEGAIELAPASKWYSRVPAGDVDGEAHVIGDDD